MKTFLAGYIKESMHSPLQYIYIQKYHGDWNDPWEDVFTEDPRGARVFHSSARAKYTAIELAQGKGEIFIIDQYGKRINTLSIETCTRF